MVGACGAGSDELVVVAATSSASVDDVMSEVGEEDVVPCEVVEVPERKANEADALLLPLEVELPSAALSARLDVLWWFFTPTPMPTPRTIAKSAIPPTQMAIFLRLSLRSARSKSASMLS